MQGASLAQLKVLAALERKVVEMRGQDGLKDLYGGGMFIVPDGGEFAAELMVLAGPAARRRPSADKKSSHFSTALGYEVHGEQQYGFDFPKGTLLFGTVPPPSGGSSGWLESVPLVGGWFKSSDKGVGSAKKLESTGSSFFQTEGAGVTGLVSAMEHGMHYVKHVTQGINTGMSGESIHTEKTGKSLELTQQNDDPRPQGGLRRRKPDTGGKK